MEILLFQARKEIKKSRWNGVIDNLDRKLRRGRAEIRDLGAEQLKKKKNTKRWKGTKTPLPYRGGASRTLEKR